MTAGLTRMAALAAVGMLACGGDHAAGGDHKVFFVGYVYDGASGARLAKSSISSVSIVYGDRTIRVDMQDDGRFVSRDPLPTWRDYTVTIDANGYRSFVSYNAGVDVPASLASTDGIAQASTTQTLDFAAYLFPVAVKSPAMTLTITVPDPATGVPASNGVAGTLRLRPQSLPSIQIGGNLSSTPANRIWANDEDLLTQTVVKPFASGLVTVDEGELVYGVTYEVAIYDVPGHQPALFSGTNGLVAGVVTSRTYPLSRDLQDPLAIVLLDASTCVPPAGADTSYGGVVTIRFNAPIEVLGTSYREDFDNALSITEPTSTTTAYYCPLKSTPSVDATQQERGSKVEVSGASLIFSFNPSIGLAPTYFGSPCVVPPTITSISYGGASLLTIQPVGDPSRRQSLSTLLYNRQVSSTVTCPTRAF